MSACILLALPTRATVAAASDLRRSSLARLWSRRQGAVDDARATRRTAPGERGAPDAKCRRHGPGAARALAAQDYAGDWELLVVDDRSRDGGRAIAARELESFVRARLLSTSGHAGNGAGRARNVGILSARGELLVFCDADDVAAPGWLSELVVAAPEGDLVAGALDIETLNAPSIRHWHDTPAWRRRRAVHRFLPHVSTANCAVWADVFDAVGGNEERHRGAEDRDFAYRAQLAGYRVRRAPDAVVAYRYRSSLRATARQQFEYGTANARLFRHFREAGMPRTSLCDALRGWSWAVCTIPVLPWSAARRGMWMARAAECAGHAVGSLRHRVRFL